MKIFKPIGSKERFAEIFQGVTKVRLNEAFMSDAASLNPENVLNMAFEQLRSGGLKIEQSNSQGSGEQSYVELVCKDKQSNDITFTFKVQSSAGDQDGVYNVNGVIMTNFTFDSPNEEVVELDESGLRRFNAQHGKELFDAIQQYIDVEEEEPIDSLYEDAIRKIDFAPFGKDSFDKMQTGKAYVDEKPINPLIRVKAPELDKFVKESESLAEFDKPVSKLKMQPMVAPTTVTEDMNSILHYSQAARDAGVLFPNAKEMGATNQQILVGALKEVGVEVKNIIINGDGYELLLSYNGKSFKAMLKKSYGSASNAVKLIKNKLGIQESLYEEEEKSKKDNKEIGLYPDQLGKKFKPKNQMPHKKKKIQTTIKISENFEDDNNYEEVPDIEIPTDKKAGVAARMVQRDISSAYGDKDKVEAGSDFHVDEKSEEPLTGDDNVTDTEFMNTERQGLQGSENDVPEDTTNDVNPETEMGTENDIEIGAGDEMSHEPESDEIDQIAQDKEETGEVIPGGDGEGKSATDFDPEQILMGMRVEMEHSDDPMYALEITIDHLTEDPEYYTSQDTPEDSAQVNASADANGSEGDDKNTEDILLGFKPHNVGDEVPDTSRKPKMAEPEETSVEEPEEVEPEKKEDELDESVNKRINNLITEEQIKTAKLTLSNRNIPTGMSKKEAVQILMNNNLKKML